jgi:hypothetical protein
MRRDDGYPGRISGYSPAKDPSKSSATTGSPGKDESTEHSGDPETVKRDRSFWRRTRERIFGKSVRDGFALANRGSVRPTHQNLGDT